MALMFLLNHSLFVVAVASHYISISMDVEVVNAGLAAVAVFAVVVVVTIHFCAVAVPNVIAECR